MTKKANGEGSINKYKNGWRATITIGRGCDGKLIRKQFYGKTKNEVMKKVDDFKVKNTLGFVENDNKVTIQEWVIIWLKEYKINDCRDSTLERYDGICKNYIINSDIGIIKLKDIKPSNIQIYYNKLIKKYNKSPTTIKMINKVLSGAFRQAQKEQRILYNPCLAVTLPKINNKNEINTFTISEQKKFLQSLEGNRDKAIYYLALGSGLRIGEILALRWGDINFERKEISVNKSIKRVKILDDESDRKTRIIEQKPKTKYSNRIVPLPSNIINELIKHRNMINIERIKAGDKVEITSEACTKNKRAS